MFGGPSGKLPAASRRQIRRRVPHFPHVRDDRFDLGPFLFWPACVRVWRFGYARPDARSLRVATSVRVRGRDIVARTSTGDQRLLRAGGGGFVAGRSNARRATLVGLRG